MNNILVMRKKLNWANINLTGQAPEQFSQVSSSTESIDSEKEDYKERLNGFAEILRNDFADSPPFTIQRIAEIVQDPNKYYNSIEKWFNALDRLLAVTSTSTDFNGLVVYGTQSSSGFSDPKHSEGKRQKACLERHRINRQISH